MRNYKFINYSKLFLMALSLFFISCQTEESTKQKVKTEEFKFNEITIAEIQKAYAEGTLTVTELTRAYINRIEEVDKNGPAVNSIIMVNPDALEIAKQLDEELKNGKKRSPLHGIPVVLKDNIDTRDKMPCTAGSRALTGSFPLQDSYIVKKLREAGALILAKANLSEWANFRGEMSSSGWSGLGGQTKNPYVLSRNPCGSSSGSAVSVSANLTVLAIGTETNGSIVCPSSANGVVGIKPTVGLLSRSGIIPISFTQDTPGPMARTVTDAAICLGTMVGIDSLDAKTLASEGNFYTDYTQFLKTDGLKGKRIGLYKPAMGKHFKVDSLMNKTIEILKNEGAEVIEIDNIADSKAGYHSFQVMLFEYKDGLNNYFKSLGAKTAIKDLSELIEFNKTDSVELEFYNQVYLEMAQEKEGLDSEEYKTHLSEMLKLSRKEGIDKVMSEHNLDAFVAPTGSPAWKTDHVNGDHFMLASSSPAARAGYPNITVPMGFVEELPVGVSFFGKAWSEPVLIEIAYAYEQATKHRKAPKFLNE